MSCHLLLFNFFFVVKSRFCSQHNKFTQTGPNYKWSTKHSNGPPQQHRRIPTQHKDWSSKQQNTKQKSSSLLPRPPEHHPFSTSQHSLKTQEIKPHQSLKSKRRKLHPPRPTTTKQRKLVEKYILQDIVPRLANTRKVVVWEPEPNSTHLSIKSQQIATEKGGGMNEPIRTSDIGLRMVKSKARGLGGLRKLG